MNRPIYFIEFKSSETPERLSELVQKALSQANIAPQMQNPKKWVVYCNDRKHSDWKRLIRPRSKIVVVDREAPPVNLEIAFENKEFLVVDKPQGLPTQKTLKTYEDNLFDQVRLFFIQQKSFPGGLPYVGLHHRLDRGTSGLVLLSKMRSANKEIADLFKDRTIEKEYEAYVEYEEGRLPSEWEQKDPIRRGSAKKKKFFFEVGEGGDSAHSKFRVLDKKEDHWYRLRALPKTGRTHQLRVHLSFKGHPVLGDSVYGRKKTASRLMLHAQSLNFKWRGEEIKISSKSPLDPSAISI